MKRTVFIAAILMILFALPVIADDGLMAGDHGVKWGALAAAFAIGIAALGGAMGQGKAIAAACESMARNPGMAGPIRIALLLGLAFIESLVIYALLIAFMIK